jgi:hypothetical protein
VRLAVVGSRDYPQGRYWIVRNDILHVGQRVGWDHLTLVSGGARGADAMAEQAAKDFGVPIIVHRADWKRHGRLAGMLRNEHIVEDADEMLAYFTTDEPSPGTADSIRRAQRKGIPVHVSINGGVLR